MHNKQKNLTIDQRISEEWNKIFPHTGIEESKVPLMKGGQLGQYGNYNLKDKVMELIVFLKNPLNIVVIRDQRDHKYFKELEETAVNALSEMIKLLTVKW